MDRKNIFLGLTVLALGYLSFLMVQPFIGYVLGAVIMAFVLYPVHKNLRNMIDERASAFSLVVLAVFLAFIPFLILIGAVLEDAQNLKDGLDDTESINVTEIERNIEEFTGVSVNLNELLEESVSRFTNSVLGGASAILRTVTHLLIGSMLMLFLMYYIIKDGEKFVAWLKNVLPVDIGIQESYYEKLSGTTWAVIKGHVLVAVIQGLVGGVGLFVAGVPNYIFWTFIMILLSFIPVVGAFIIWMPAAFYLLFTGNITMGVFLAVYGLAVVSMIDNFVRPLAVDRSADLHPAAIIIGVLGGLFVFGAVGLFVGPIVIGAFKSIITVVSQEELS